MAILAAASAALSLAKKVIPQHTIVGKAIGSTNTSKGVDLGKVAKDAGFEKLGSTLQSIGAMGGSNLGKIASKATGTAPGAVANSLTNVAPSQALLSGNLTGGTSASTFQTIGQSTPPDAGSAPGSKEPEAKPKDNKMLLYIGAAVVLFMFIKK